LGRSLGIQELSLFYPALGFYSTPKLELPTLAQSAPQTISEAGLAALGVFGADLDTEPVLRISPLQMALAAATLSNQGTRPAPRLALAVHTPQDGWLILPLQGEYQTVFSATAACTTAEQLAVQGKPFWMSITSVPTGTDPQAPVYTWFSGGTTSSWLGSPLALAFILEEDNSILAYEIGMRLMEETLYP
jgi:hypothetical protein